MLEENTPHIDQENSVENTELQLPTPNIEQEAVAEEDVTQEVEQEVVAEEDVTQEVEQEAVAEEEETQQPKRGAKVKKAFAIIAIVLGALLLLFGGIVGALHTKGVQTFIVGKVADKLSKMWDVDASIASFHYRPLSHLVLDRVYLSDQQRDTLAFIEQLQLEFDPLALLEDQINIQRLRLQNPYVNLQSTSDSTLNIQFLLDTPKSDSANFPFRLNIDKLELVQTRVRYNEVLIDQLDLALALPVLSADSLDIELHSLHLRAQMDRLDASFEANLHGDLDSVFAQDLQLVFRDEQLFSGDIAVYYPTELDSLYVDADCKDLYCNNDLLQDLLSQLQMKPVKLPVMVNNLGHVHYHGDVRGRLENLALHGDFTTGLGALKVNGDLHIDTTLQDIDFCGHVSTRKFQLGRLLNQSDLGMIAFQAHVDGEIDSIRLTHCVADADIQHIEYKGYTYKKIHLDGELLPEEVNGSLNIDDDNIQLNISGLADWSEEDARMDLTLRLADFQPATLNLIDQYPNLRLGATTYISLFTSGKKEEMLDNMMGYVIVDTLQIENGEDQTTMEQFKLLVDSELKDGRPIHQLRVQSDFLTANLSGAFRYQTLPATIQQLLHNYLPTLVEAPKLKRTDTNNLDFYAYFRELDSLTQVFDLDVEIPSFPTIKGYIHEQTQQIGLQAYIPNINTSGAKMEDITISLDNQNEELDLSVYVLNHLPKDNPTAAKLGDIKATINVIAQNDNIDLSVELGNTDSVRNEGIISVSSKVSKYKDKPKFDIEVLPTNIILNDSAWNIGQANISYTLADQVMDINNFSLSTDYQLIKADGRASKLASDSIDVVLNNIHLDYLLSYTEASKSISILGLVTGQATVYSVFSDPMLEAQAYIPNGGLNGVYFGDITADAELDRENNSILIYGQIVDSTQHMVAEVNGKVIPANKWWGLDIACDSLDINFIDFWTKGLIENPQGRAYGNVKVEGLDRKVWVTGGALAKDAHITVPQIGVTFSLTDSIFLDSTAIRFPDITVYDQYGNSGLFTGAVYHECFLDIRFDLWARANNMLVMDLPATQQSLFYGKVFGTGDVHIYGDERDCQIDVNARTEANTKFFLNINSASQATSSNFIKFVQPDTSSNYLLSLLRPKEQKVKTNKPTSRMRLSLQGEVTPQAEINIKLGAEDGIRGKGEGNLKLVYESPSENIQMQGAYTLQSGQFAFSLGNIVRRNFTIREGSQITWDGDPLAPTVDITGYYHTTASLRDLFGSESSQIATDRTSVPVNCVLNMKDELFNPILNFAIELPQSDESVQSQVRSMINTDEMLMRQVIYLLVFNRFYTPDYLQNTQNVGLNETYSLLSSTITGQINSWLSKLTDVFTMGFNFRTEGEGETASQEYEANFQIHPINQLIINGNFGYRYNDLSNRPFFGDLDIEYLLTPNGKFRAKAYTHTVDKYSLRQANTVQGVGFVFKHDFNWKENKNKDISQRKDSSKKEKKTKKKQQEKQ